MNLSMRIRPCPLLLLWQKVVPVWILPPRLMGDYEGICKGILPADKAGLAELIQKRLRLGSAVVQSGLLSWPISLLLPGAGCDQPPALLIICARRA